MFPEKVCEVHGEPLREDSLPVDQAWCVEMDPAAEAVKARHFPRAETFVWGAGLPDPYPVQYCPVCRAAEAAWQSARGEWSCKAAWMRLGYDPFHGTPLRTPAATLARDYVWIEKWVRTVEALGLRPWMLDLGACRDIEEYILQEVAAARRDAAPLDVVHRGRDGWRRLDGVEQPMIRGALGLDG